MAYLTYSDIFTKVHKWDEEYTYLGIQVTGKFNQHNGQDFYILDAIDIDWNGAYVEKLNTYVYSTEDLIRLFNLLEQHSIDIENNYFTKAEFNEMIDDIGDNIAVVVENKVFENLINRYEVLNAISDILIDKTKYLEIDYNNIVKDGKLTQYAKSRDFFYWDEARNIFVQVQDKNDIINNPDETYYIFLLGDIVKLNEDIFDIKEIIGEEKYNNISDSYTYTGFYNRFNNIETNISYISNYLDNNTETTIEAYNYAYTSYITSYNNSYLIGQHTQYKVYKKVEDLNSQEFKDYLLNNRNYIWILDPDTNTYTSILYENNPNYDYYMYYNKINGYGIEKEIEDITNTISDNSYILYKLSINSKNSNLIATITPSKDSTNKTQERTIGLNLKNSNIDSENGNITEGIINHENMINGVSYLFSWKIIQ